LPAPIRASISRYCFLDDKYWFVIETEYDNGRHYNLSRYYEDFYDFQIALLTEFPVEAGNSDREKKRTLPYMPGPVNYVTDAITEGRLRNLDAYVKNLLSQPPHISGCGLVRQFFAPRVGDMKAEPGVDDDARWSGGSAQSGSHGGENGHASHGLHDDTSYTMEQERHQSSARQC
jgi:bud emergence protein 1